MTKRRSHNRNRIQWGASLLLSLPPAVFRIYPLNFSSLPALSATRTLHNNSIHCDNDSATYRPSVQNSGRSAFIFLNRMTECDDPSDLFISPFKIKNDRYVMTIKAQKINELWHLAAATTSLYWAGVRSVIITRNVTQPSGSDRDKNLLQPSKQPSLSLHHQVIVYRLYSFFFITKSPIIQNDGKVQ